MIRGRESRAQEPTRKDGGIYCSRNFDAWRSGCQQCPSTWFARHLTRCCALSMRWTPANVLMVSLIWRTVQRVGLCAVAERFALTHLVDRVAVLEDLLLRAMDDASIEPDSWYAEAMALLNPPAQLSRFERPHAFEAIGGQCKRCGANWYARNTGPCCGKPTRHKVRL